MPGSRHHGQQVSLVFDSQGHLASVQPATGGSGQWVCAAFADTWCESPVPGLEHRGSLAQLAASAVAGGFGTLVCLPGTVPPLTTAAAIRAFGASAAGLPLRVLPYGAVSENLKGKDLAELADMHQAGAVAATDGWLPLQDSGLLLRALQYTQVYGGLVAVLPMDLGIHAGAQANESAQTVRTGLKPSPPLAEELAVARAIQILEYTGGRLHLCPITTAGSVQLVRDARARGLDVSAGTLGYHLLLDDSLVESFDTSTKVFPPLRTADDCRALALAVADGTITVLASGHSPRSIEEKKVEFQLAEPGIQALQTTLACALTAAQQHSLPIEPFIDALTTGPASRYSLSLPAELEPGLHRSQLAVFAPEDDFVFAPAGPGFVNSPLKGKKLKGRVLAQ